MCIHALATCSMVRWGEGDMCALVLVMMMGRSMFSHLLTTAAGTWVLPGTGEPLTLGRPCHCE